MQDDPSKGKPGEEGENATGTTGGAGGAGGVGGEGEDTGGPGGAGGTGGAASAGDPQPVVIEAIRDPKMAKGVKALIFIGLYLIFISSVAVIATALTPGPPF